MAANTPSKYLIGSVITFFCLYLLVQIILSSALSLGKNTMPRENTPKVAVSDRIKPIGEVYISGAPIIVEQTIEIAKDISPGEKIVTAVCLRCHGVGL